MRRSIGLLCAGALLLGCASEIPCVGVSPDFSIPSYGRRAHVLFVLDSTWSTVEERAALAAAIPGFLSVLAESAIHEVHVGVVSGDLGTPGFAVPGCGALGDDGLLLNRGDLSRGCVGTYPSFLDFYTGDDPGLAAQSVGCVITAASGGCGFQQPLEAALKALSPSAPTWWTADGYVAPMFSVASFGHADRENADFVGESEALVVVMLTDDDDCSVSEASFFDPSGSTPLGLRCISQPESLHAVERYVDGLIGLRRAPGRLVFAPIVGIPADLSPGEEHYDELADDPRMEPRIDPAEPTRVVPSCDGPLGSAYPPERVVETARRLEMRGASVTVQSLCDGDLGAALQSIASRVVEVAETRCLGLGALPRAPDGSPACELTAMLPTGSSCSDIDGASRVEGAGEPGEVCAFARLEPSAADRAAGALPAGRGWLLDDYTRFAERMCATSPGSPWGRWTLTTPVPAGTTLAVRCVYPSPAELGVGRPCGSDAECPPAAALPAVELSCDSGPQRCAVSCRSNRDCAVAGPDNGFCVWREVDAPHGFCATEGCE